MVKLRIWRYVGVTPGAKHYHCRIEYKDKYWADKFLTWEDAMFWFADTFTKNINIGVKYQCEFIDCGKKDNYDWFREEFNKYWQKYIIQ